MDAILKEIGLGWTRPEGSETAYEIGLRTGEDRRRIRTMLDKAVREGKMTSVMGPNPRYGGQCKFYSPVKNEAEGAK